MDPIRSRVADRCLRSSPVLLPASTSFTFSDYSSFSGEREKRENGGGGSASYLHWKFRTEEEEEQKEEEEEDEEEVG